MKHFARFLFAALLMIGSMPLFAADEKKDEVKQVVANLVADQEDNKFEKLAELMDRLDKVEASKDRIYSADSQEMDAYHQEVLEIKADLMKLLDGEFEDMLNLSDDTYAADRNSRASLIGSFVLIASKSAHSSLRSSMSASSQLTADTYAADRNSVASLIASFIVAGSERSSKRSSMSASSQSTADAYAANRNSVASLIASLAATGSERSSLHSSVRSLALLDQDDSSARSSELDPIADRMSIISSSSIFENDKKPVCCTIM